MVKLKSQDGRVFEGEYSATLGSDIQTGKATARVYWDEIGPLLIGNWQEGGNGNWFVRLNEVMNFPDEKN